jgi:hypothetical protein
MVRTGLRVMPTFPLAPPPTCASRSSRREPTWSRGDLFFETPDQHIMAAAYTVKGDSFVHGKPRLWSEKPIGGSLTVKSLDLAPDGKRVVALKYRAGKCPLCGRSVILWRD